MREVDAHDPGLGGGQSILQILDACSRIRDVLRTQARLSVCLLLRSLSLQYRLPTAWGCQGPAKPLHMPALAGSPVMRNDLSAADAGTVPGHVHSSPVPVPP